MEKIHVILRYLRSKLTWQWAVILVLIFFAFVISDNNIFDRISYSYQISNLKSEIEYYQEMKKSDSIKIEQLKVDKQEIEKFGREKYLMKKDNEDLFLIEE